MRWLSKTGNADFENCYSVTPILGAIISDQYLGKYNTILYFAFVYLAGVLILFCTSLPVAIHNNTALPGVIVAMIVIGLGTGGIKSNVSPLIAEQYRGTRQKIKTLKTGERVIIDPAITIQRIYMVSIYIQKALIKEADFVKDVLPLHQCRISRSHRYHRTGTESRFLECISALPLHVLCGFTGSGQWKEILRRSPAKRIYHCQCIPCDVDRHYAQRQHEQVPSTPKPACRMLMSYRCC